MRRVALLTTLLLLVSPVLHAVLVPVTQGAFSSPTVLDFSGIANEEQITTQFSGQGVTFSGGIYGLTNPGDTLFFPGNPPVIASDWVYSQSQHGPLPITATFSSDQNLIGFYDEANTGDVTTLSFWLNGNFQGSLSMVSVGLNAQFFGVYASDGFDTVTIDMSGPSDHFIALDQFQFQPGAPAGTPEPGTLGLLAIGAVGLLGSLRRKTA